MADEPTPTSTPAPTPTPTPAPPAWHAGVEAETLGFWQNKGYDLADPKAFALKLTEHYRAAEKHIGAPPDRLIRLPDKPEDTAGWNGVYERLGVPKEAKEYDFSGVQRADGSDVPAALSDAIRAALHTARVPKDRGADVVKAVVKSLDDAASQEATVAQGKIDAQKADLKKNWGVNYDFNLLKAMEGARRLGISPDAVASMEKQIGYAAVMDAMRKIGQGTSEDTFVEGNRGPNGVATTREGAISRKGELMADKDWAGRYLAGGVKERQEMDALNIMIDGEAA